MRTPTLRPSGRERSRIASALRSRPVAAATATLVAAGVALAGVAVADTAHATTWKTSGDLFQTPWFEAGLAPWSGSDVTRELAPTPNGRYAARVTESRGRAVIDDWPGEVKTVKGGHYMASGLFRAARFLSWNRPVYLVIRETNSLGQWVGAQTASRRLRFSYWDRLTGQPHRSAQRRHARRVRVPDRTRARSRVLVRRRIAVRPPRR